MNSENFIKSVNEFKEKNSLDLSSSEDLSIALMNLISLEEHLIFSYMKTSETKYLDFLEQIRELRKKLLKEIVKKDDDSEKWCMSKHLLATVMRLVEVGTKYQHENKKKEAEKLFIEAFNLYSIFWALNSKIDIKKVDKDLKPSDTKLSKLSLLIKKILDCCKE